jgi:hypothetical protein
MKTRTLTIEVTKTVQVQSYEPVTVRVSETVALDDSDDAAEVRTETYRRVTQAVKKYIDNEHTKYVQDLKQKKDR